MDGEHDGVIMMNNILVCAFAVLFYFVLLLILIGIGKLADLLDKRHKRMV